MAKTLFVTVLALLAIAAQAGLIDGTVLINRAANNRTITVQYDGLNASLVEMRVNGESVASRTVDQKLTAGETNFALNPAILADGDNVIEVRLYDAQGKLVGHEKTSVYVDRKPTGPVFLERPLPGTTVTGPVQISLGLKQNLRSMYVSFFIDDEFTAMKNYPPYTYLWDTSRATNGWHEIQAWVVDENNRTFKTEKMRLFVNNPSGRTERINPLTPPTGGTTGDPAGAKGLIGEGVGNGVTEAVLPIAGVAVSTNTSLATVAAAAGTKAPGVSKGDVTGQRALLPTGTRVAKEPIVNAGSANVEPDAPAKLPLKPINLGSRLYDTETFSLTLNGEMVKFDVMPTVIEGVPFTPFRHLFEQAGGTVKWIHESKTVEADGMGDTLSFTIGADYGLLNGSQFLFERTPFIQSGRTIVPLSFVSSTLNMNVQYDPNTGHVLITNAAKK